MPLPRTPAASPAREMPSLGLRAGSGSRGLRGSPRLRLGSAAPPPSALLVPALGCCSHLWKMPLPLSPPANLSCRELAGLHRRSHTPAEEPGHAANAFAHGFPSPLAVCSQRCRSLLFLITLSRAEDDFRSTRSSLSHCRVPRALCRVLPGCLCLGRELGSTVQGCKQGRKPRTGTAGWGRAPRSPCPAHRRASPRFHDL